MNDVAVQETKNPRVKRGTYTPEYVINLAKSEGWTKSSDWRKANLSSYMAASRNKWLVTVYEALGWKVRKTRSDATVSSGEVQG